MSMVNARIELIIGPVFSGKTTELIRRVRRYSVQGKRIFPINFNGDIESHDSDRYQNCILVNDLEEITTKYLNKLKNSDVLMIDNLHFYHDAEEYIPVFCNKYKKIVIASGLDSNYERVPYLNVLNLIPKSENVTKLTALSNSKNRPAIFSKKINDSKFSAVTRKEYLNSKNCGEFQLILGPMFSGKTTEIIRRGLRYANIGKKILSINHASDTRYTSGEICSHDKRKIQDTISLSNLEDLIKIYKDNIDKSDVIVIDEIQFFNNSYDTIKKLVEDFNKIVIVAGLDGDHMQRPFGDTCKLVSFADSVEKLNAVCVLTDNYQEAPFTRRLNFDNRQQLVGSNELYIACSREIYYLPFESFIQKYKSIIMKEKESNFSSAH